MAKPDRLLHRALKEKDLKGVVGCLQKGADVNFMHSGNGFLHHAAAMDSPYGKLFTQLFLDHGGDPNLRGEDGVTPIHVAVTHGNEDTLQLLINAGGDPMCKDGRGRTAFDLLEESDKTSRGTTTKENILRVLRSTRRGRRSLDFSLDNGDNDLDFTSPHFKDIAVKEQGDLHGTIHQPIESSPRPSLDYNYTSNNSSNSHRNSSYLHESLVTQNFIEEDESAFSFPNVQEQPSWFSTLLSCAGAPRFMKPSSVDGTGGVFGTVARNRVFRWLRKSLRRRVSRHSSSSSSSTSVSGSTRQEFG